jgi:hypothetical protein
VEEYQTLKDYWRVTPQLERLLGVELTQHFQRADHRGTHTLFPPCYVPNAIDDRPFPAEAQVASADADDPVD